MPVMVTDVVAGIIMYGDFIASGYVPAEEQSNNGGEKVYVQITAPNLQSYKIRLTDAAVAQMSDCDLRPMSPVMLDVRPMVFRDTQYWRGESFHVRPDGHRPVWPSSRKAAPEAVLSTNGAPGNPASAAKPAGKS